MKRSANKMDYIFYLTILSGAITVMLSVVTYREGKRKEIEADLVNKKLLEKTDQVVLLQGNLLNEMGQNREKSDAIITIQNKLQEANEQILILSNKNVKQVLGDGVPTLSADVWPDKLIVLSIQNNNEYPIYDISIILPNFGSPSSLKEASEQKISPWEEMRNGWINISAFNLPPKTTKKIYSFNFPEQSKESHFTLSIVTRHGTFKGLVLIKRVEQGHLVVECEVTDLHGKHSDVNH